MPTNTRDGSTIYRFLAIAFGSISAVALVLTALHIAPLLPHDNMTPAIAYGTSGAAAIGVLTAWLFFKPRVLRRRLGQSAENYWASQDVAASVQPVWLLLEAAATLAATGYLLTGSPFAAMVAAVAMVAFWSCRPQKLAQA